MAVTSAEILGLCIARGCDPTAAATARHFVPPPVSYDLRRGLGGRLYFESLMGGVDMEHPFVDSDLLLTTRRERIPVVSLLYPGARFTIVVCHTGDVDVGMRYEWGADFCVNTRCNVVLFDFDGFGVASGRPSSTGACLGLLRVVEWVLERPWSGGLRGLVLYGEGVGGGPCLWLASSWPVRGVVLLGCSESLLSGIAATPLASCGDAFANRSRASRLRCSVLVAHAQGDPVVPFRHGRRLAEALDSESWTEPFFPPLVGRSTDIPRVLRDRWIRRMRKYLTSLTPGDVPYEDEELESSLTSPVARPPGRRARWETVDGWKPVLVGGREDHGVRKHRSSSFVGVSTKPTSMMNPLARIELTAAGASMAKDDDPTPSNPSDSLQDAALPPLQPPLPPAQCDRLCAAASKTTTFEDLAANDDDEEEWVTVDPALLHAVATPSRLASSPPLPPHTPGGITPSLPQLPSPASPPPARLVLAVRRGRCEQPRYGEETTSKQNILSGGEGGGGRIPPTQNILSGGGGGGGRIPPTQNILSGGGARGGSVPPTKNILGGGGDELPPKISFPPPSKETSSRRMKRKPLQAAIRSGEIVVTDPAEALAAWCSRLVRRASDVNAEALFFRLPLILRDAPAGVRSPQHVPVRGSAFARRLRDDASSRAEEDRASPREEVEPSPDIRSSTPGTIQSGGSVTQLNRTNTSNNNPVLTTATTSTPTPTRPKPQRSSTKKHFPSRAQLRNSHFRAAASVPPPATDSHDMGPVRFHNENLK